jgi:hypothetical protein
MTSKVGSLIISLALESGAFKSGLTASEKDLKAATKRMAAIGDSLKGFGQSMSLAVTLPFAALAKSSIDAAMQSKDALAQVQQGIKSMGNAAGRSAEQLQALASKEMFASLYDDDDILRQVSATLLTFGNVAGATFDSAQQAIIDMSAKLGTDLQSSAIQVGKALNDPIKGITALSRVGVSFTEQQKDQINAMVEAGNVAGAQQIILAELAKEFGGAAKAAADANPFTVLKHAADDFKEAVGAVLLRSMPPLINALTSLLQSFNSLSPGTQSTIVGIGLLGAAIGPVTLVFGNLIKMTSGVAGAMSLLSGTAGPLAAARFGFAGLLAAITPVGVVLTALIATMGYVIYKFTAAKEANGTYAKGLEQAGFVSQRVAEITEKLANAHGKERDQALNAARAEAELTKQKIAGASAAIKLAQAELARSRTRLAAADFTAKNLPIGTPDDITGVIYNNQQAASGVSQAEANMAAARKTMDSLNADLGKLQGTIGNVTAPKVSGAGAVGGAGGKVKGGGGAASSTDTFTSSLHALVDQLLPADAALREFRSDQAMLEVAHAKGKISLDDYIRSLEVLRGRIADSRLSTRQAPEELFPNLPELANMGATLTNKLDKFHGAANKNARGIAAANVMIVKSFEDMALESIDAMQRVTNAFQGGSFLDKVRAITGLFMKLAGTGLFGKTIQTRVNSTPGRAVGGPVNQWTPYIVGERGPELFVPGAGGRIVPNSAMSGGGGATRIHVEASPYFDVRVNGQIVKSAPALMDGGAKLAQQQLGAQQFRSLG